MAALLRVVASSLAELSDCSMARAYAPAGSRRPVRTERQARRLNATGFAFAVVGRGELLMLLLFKAMLLLEGARPKSWRPTAARTFFQGPEEYCS